MKLVNEIQEQKSKQKEKTNFFSRPKSKNKNEVSCNKIWKQKALKKYKQLN